MHGREEWVVALHDYQRKRVERPVRPIFPFLVTMVKPIFNDSKVVPTCFLNVSYCIANGVQSVIVNVGT